MLVYLGYLIIAGIASTFFRYSVSILSMIQFGIICAIEKGDIDSLIIRHPRLFSLLGIINHTFISVIYPYVILYSTGYYADRFGGNFWFYMIASVIWSISILSGISNFYLIAFFTCTVGLIMMLWQQFWIAPILLGIISAIISTAYHFGRINTAIDINNNNL